MLDQRLKITGHAIRDNMFNRPVGDLMPPVFLWVRGSNVAHLTSPETLSTEDRSYSNDGTYRVQCQNRAEPRLRCFHHGFTLVVNNEPHASATKPAHLRICKRCAKVVGAALLDHITSHMVGSISRAVARHFELGYHRWGTRYSNKVRPLRGSKPGSIKFLFLHREMREVEIQLLDIENWTWLTEQPTNDEWGTWIGNEIVRRRREFEKNLEQNFRVWRQLEEDTLEEGLFSDL